MHVWGISEPALRMGVFVAMLVVLVVLEWLRPGPNAPPQRGRRWFANLGLVTLDTLLVRLLLPAGAVGVALWVQSRGWGLFHALQWAGWIEFTLSLLLLDVAIYWQHRVFHVLPWLWRWHRVHHGDATLDASTGVRFHPGEIVLSLGIKTALIALLGIGAMAVLVFEVLLSSFSLFTHANVRLPRRLEPAVRVLLVTPEMHVVHHSTLDDEQRCNYGFHLSCWDRLFGSYLDASRQAPQRLGVDGIDGGDTWRLDRMLMEPWQRR
ncbi:MAG TPA: sterol desaturase family protein [Xanthomonadaceae bacterium]|nr:sterol desaturase family protein [Xanthomonadaceae bacterium]